MLARRLERPEGAAGAGRGAAVKEEGLRRGPAPPGRWREAGRRPTVGPRGQVRWWERSAPGGDEVLWAAVQRLQRRRLQLRISVCALQRRLVAWGHPVARETLSRVLNGQQPTSWSLVESLAEVLGSDVSVPRTPRPAAATREDPSGRAR